MCILVEGVSEEKLAIQILNPAQLAHKCARMTGAHKFKTHLNLPVYYWSLQTFDMDLQVKKREGFSSTETLS